MKGLRLARGSVRYFLIVLAVLVLGLASACKDRVSGDSNLLLKPIDDLTPEDIESMVAVVQTNYGPFRLKLFPREAPNTVRSFISLVREGFYNGLIFYRIVPTYIIVGGCPEGDGTGGPGYTVALEANERHHSRGAVGLLHPPFLPDNGGSQFYIMLRDDYRLDGSYTVFGQVISGMDVLDRISDLPNTGQKGRPNPFVPLQAVIIENLHLDLMGNP
jgi:peptidyl-prolyl cis-trans isomerase B (cyclophilin B)